MRSRGHTLSVRDQEGLHSTESLVRKGIVEHTTLASMGFDICNVPDVGDVDVVWPSTVVRFGLYNVALVAEDRLEGRRSVHDHGIRTIAKNGPLRQC